MKSRVKPQILGATALSATLLLSACSGGVDTSGLETKVVVEGGGLDLPDVPEVPDVPEPEVPDEPEPEPEATEPDDVEPQAPSGDYTNPDWAHPVSEEGDLLNSVREGGFQIDVYQVALGEASDDSLWEDEETGEPLLRKGDPVVALNMIISNIGDEEVPLSNLFASPRMNYDSSETFLGAMEDFNSEWLLDLGLNPDPFIEYPNPAVFPIEAGESISYGVIYEHRNEGATMSFSIRPADDDGDLDFDSEYNLDFETTFTIE